MENGEKKQRLLKQFLQSESLTNGVIFANQCYLNVVFSPAASENKNVEDKLAIALTFQEWCQVRELIHEGCIIGKANGLSSRLERFLLEAMRQIPTPEKSTLLHQKDETVDEFKVQDELIIRKKV